ncbi:unnamed protein product, partial [Brenthis ino]
MSRPKRIKQMVKLGKDGHVPQPFSHNIQTELTAMNNPIKLKRKTIIFFLFNFPTNDSVLRKVCVLAEIEGQSGTQKRNLSSDMEEEYIKTTEKFWKRIHFPHRKKIASKLIIPPCDCRLQCRNKFSEDQRKEIFKSYWNLASLQRQRNFLCTCIELINISCRRIKNLDKPRTPNCSFSLLNNGQCFKVCKKFLLNTLGITERTLRTVIETRNYNAGNAPKDNRGKHGNHKKTDPELVQSVKDHINSVPRIESHYLRANTSREFIDGGLTIAELHRNYKTQRSSLQKEAVTYDVYAKIFKTDFNISFFFIKERSVRSV